MKFEPEQLAAKCVLTQDNPKRGGSADRYDGYKCATTLQMVLDLGGSRGDLANDIIKGYITIEDEDIKDALMATRNAVELRPPYESQYSSPVEPYVPDDADMMGVVDADRDEAKKYLRWLFEQRVIKETKKKRLSAPLTGSDHADKCATRKVMLIEYVVANGGDGDRIRNEIEVSCKQRGDGASEGGIDYYFHSQDGKRYRSNKEVCKKMLGIDAVNPSKKRKSAKICD
jgi:hypothetical protein